jgi:hypothetical protein
MTPNFDELIGAEPAGSERERLRRAHELLVTAGAPPELTPALERAPDTGFASVARRRQTKRKAMLLLAAALAVVAVFFTGYGVGNRGGGANAVGQLALRGTALAPHARATLAIFPRVDGNWPMLLTVKDLPKLPTGAEYAVYLLQRGERYPCGTFVSSGGSRPLTVKLNAPYQFEPGAKWVVARKPLLGNAPGATVLQPA